MLKGIPDRQTYHEEFRNCSLVGASMIAFGVRDSVVVFHGVVGCRTTIQHLQTDFTPNSGRVPVVSTGFDENDVVSGGLSKLTQTLERVVQGKPRLIWILTGCATALIGDDIRGAAARVEKNHGIPCIALNTTGTAGSLYHGADLALSAILDKFYLSQRKSGRSKLHGLAQRKGVNILGPALMGSRKWFWDLEEICSLLEAADIPVNLALTHNTSFDDLAGNFARAEANLWLLGEELPEFQQRCEHLGMVQWGQDAVLPLGVANTEEWYLAVAERFGNLKKAKARLESDQQQVTGILKDNFNASWVLNAVAGKRAGVLTNAGFAAALARFLFYDLNIRPVIVGLFADSKVALERAQDQLAPLKEYCDLKILENPTYFEYGKALKEYGVHCAIGQRHERVLVEGMKIPHLALGGAYFFNSFRFVPWPYMGVRGFLSLLGEMGELMERMFHDKEGWQNNSFIELKCGS
ncbi:MAG: nitrogenase component 1 [Clostridia bacterium]|nr:nitrogenase component 1 [Clostridia bacterium]